MNKNHVYECKSLFDVSQATTELARAELRDLYVDVDGTPTIAQNFKGVYNTKSNKLCSVVVPHYNVVTHKEYFMAFSSALSRLGIKYEMQITDLGNKAFADITFLDRNVKFENLNEEFNTGVRLVNSYDKTSGLAIIPRYTRLACMNGMIMTRSEKSLSIRHHSKLAIEIDIFVETRLNDMINKDEELMTWVSNSMNDSVEWQTACSILDKLIGQPKHLEQILQQIGISLIKIEDKQSKKKTFTYVWDDEKVKKDTLTRWEVYNAITRYLSHGAQISPLVQSYLHQKAENVLLTPLAKLPRVEVRL